MAIYEDIFTRPAVGGRYKLLKRLGRGAFGEVFLADQELAGVPGVKLRQVAIKLFTHDYITPQNAEKVFSEALLLERLAASARANGEPVHLVTIYDLGILLELSATPFIAMECVYGALDKQLAAAPALPLDTVVGHLRGICSGLKLAHGHTPAVVHRDLKPANILIERNGFLKVADFGLAIDRYQAFLEGGPAGTISYAPPEGRNGELPTPAFDIYSLGVMMLEMLAHRNALEETLRGAGKDPAKVDAALTSAQARMAELRDPADGMLFADRLLELRKSSAAQEILRRCLAVEPGRRYANAMELDEALADLQAGRFVPAPSEQPETGRERVTRLLNEAGGLLKQDNLGDAEQRLMEVMSLSPREDRYFHLLSQLRERQLRWDDAVAAQKEGNAIVAARRADRRADPILIERLARLYERSGKNYAADVLRKSLEGQR